ncbi:unnamed protein product [Gadus morhua 'NCC']
MFTDWIHQLTLFSSVFIDWIHQLTLFSSMFTDWIHQLTLFSSMFTDWIHQLTLFSSMFTDWIHQLTLFSSMFTDWIHQLTLFSSMFTDWIHQLTLILFPRSPPVAAGSSAAVAGGPWGPRGGARMPDMAAGPPVGQNAERTSTAPGSSRISPDSDSGAGQSLRAPVTPSGRAL